VIGSISRSQESIQNVATYYLPFWHQHATTHFDYGYVYSGGDIYIAEKWNPLKVYGYVPSYGNPFGFHGNPSSYDYNAVRYSPSGRTVY